MQQQRTSASLRADAEKRLRHHPPRGTAGGAIPPTVVLPIDQAEELFAAGDEEAGAAVTMIGDVVRADPCLLVGRSIAHTAKALRE